MNKYFEPQLKDFTGTHCTLYYLVEQPDGGLFTERAVHNIGDKIYLKGYKFVRMMSETIPVFKLQ